MAENSLSRNRIDLLTTMVSTGAGSVNASGIGYKSFQARGTVANSTGSASIDVQATNFPSATAQDWVSLGTITLTLGVTSTTDGFVLDAPWYLVRGFVNTMTGATPTVDLIMYKEEE